MKPPKIDPITWNDYYQAYRPHKRQAKRIAKRRENTIKSLDPEKPLDKSSALDIIVT